jgi:hypothetical protein
MPSKPPKTSKSLADIILAIKNWKNVRKSRDTPQAQAIIDPTRHVQLNWIIHLCLPFGVAYAMQKDDCGTQPATKCEDDSLAFKEIQVV